MMMMMNQSYKILTITFKIVRTINCMMEFVATQNIFGKIGSRTYKLHKIYKLNQANDV